MNADGPAEAELAHCAGCSHRKGTGCGCDCCTPTELDPTAAAWWQAAVAANAEIARLTEIRDRAVEHVKAAMGGHFEATIGGKPAVTWALSKPGQMLDRAALEAAYGADVIAGFLRDKKAARPFKVLAGGDDA